MVLSFRLCLLAWLGVAMCFDHTVFKTCDQSSFCRRCRNMEPNKSTYEVYFNSLQVTNSALTAQLVNMAEDAVFNLSIESVESDTFRLMIKEHNPLRERFQVYLSLKELRLSYLEVVDRTESAVTVKSGKNSFILYAKPFRIEFYSDGEVVATVNSRGLFKFEQYRAKRQAPPQQDDQSPDAPVADPNPTVVEDPGAWEENFKSHRDTKPFGPSAVAMDITFPGAAHAYGIPEHAERLVLKDTKGKSDPFRLYNLDVFEYELNSPVAIYGAVPLLYTHGSLRTTGFFWNNPTETWIDITSTSNSENNMVNSIVNFVSGGSATTAENSRNKIVDAHFMSETGIIDVFILMGPKPKDVIQQYANLTGVAPLPQYFALAYHQSRWNYKDEEDVRFVSNNFNDFDMPMDVMWLDIEYTDGKKYFTWDLTRFPHALDMQHNLTAQGRKLVVIIDPHIKRESGYFLHETALEKKYYVNNAEGNVYEGWCWPGPSSYLDFVNPDVLDYYQSLYRLDNFPQSTNDMYLWNDMNEPSVFNGPEVTMPKDCIHHGGWEHREIHNLYGLLQTKGTYDGLFSRSKGTRRPFILTRSHFAGTQRYAAVWTGDNAAQWDHLAFSIPMCLSLSLGGISFCGADVGGFFGNPTPELMARWYQTGAFLPFFRAHSHVDSNRREPYLYPEETRDLLRAALRKRYTYLPHWYTLFREHELTGLPVMRPLFMEFPDESKLWTIDTTYLLGSSLLVRPVTELGVSEVQVYFPGGDSEVWYDVDTYEKHIGSGSARFFVDMAKIPVFQRGGSIIPKKERVRRASALTHDDPYTLIVALDVNGNARGKLYIDDGESFEYVNNLQYLYIDLEFKNNELVAKKINNDASFDTKSWLERVIILGHPGSVKSATVTEQTTTNVLEVKYDAKQSALTVRKPEVSMKNNWRIKLNLN